MKKGSAEERNVFYFAKGIMSTVASPTMLLSFASCTYSARFQSK